MPADRPARAIPTPRPAPVAPARLLTAEQVADILGVTPPTLANWRCRRHGPAYVRVGRLARYRVDDVEAYIQSRTVPAHVAPDRGAA